MYKYASVPASNAIAALDNHEFLIKLKQVIASKMKGFKRYGAATGAGAGSGVGGTVGLVKSIKDQKDGKMDEMDTRAKVKQYLINMAKPGAIGAVGGATLGTGVGALAKRHTVNKIYKGHAANMGAEEAALRASHTDISNARKANMATWEQHYAEREHARMAEMIDAELKNIPGLDSEQIKRIARDTNNNNPGFQDRIRETLKLNHPEFNKSMATPDELVRGWKQDVYDTEAAKPDMNLFSAVGGVLKKKGEDVKDYLREIKKSNGTTLSLAPAKDFNKIYKPTGPKLTKATDGRRREYNVSTSTKTPGLKLAKYI